MQKHLLWAVLAFPRVRVRFFRARLCIRLSSLILCVPLYLSKHAKWG